MKNQGLLSLYSAPGVTIGTGIIPPKTGSRSCSWTVLGGVLAGVAEPSDLAGAKSRRGMTTPHSQFRQFNFGTFVLLSFIRRPQALSDKLALPTYAHPVSRPPVLLRSAGAVKINLLCINSPARLLMQSRNNSFGKSDRSYHCC